MKQPIMPKGSALIYQFIKELGGITDAQVTKLLKADASNKEFFINYLRKKYIKEIAPGRYVAYNNPVPYSKEMEMCAWVLLGNEGVNMELDRKEYFQSEHPAQLFFQKGSVVYNLAYIDSNRKVTLDLLQQLYYARKGDLVTEEDDSYKYVFVVDDERVIDMIHSTGLSMPYVIAFLKDFHENEPTIQYIA